MARAPVKLRITQGTDEANDGTNRYPVERDGTVVVPAEVADRLMRGGGFIEVVGDAPAAPKGWATLTHPTSTGCSWGGLGYEPDKNGVFTVPLGAVADLASHGFVPTATQPKAEAPEPVAEDPAHIEPEPDPAEAPEPVAEE